MRRPKPNWLRRLGRDRPGAFELLMRIREKSQILAYRAFPTAKHRRATSRPPLGREALRDAFAELGLTHGDRVIVHSSWDQVGSLAPNPSALIAALRDAIGPEGTLCMPAYPHLPAGKPKVFDVRRTPSNAGLLSEVFRRMPGVLRSAQLRSVAALGPMASELTCDHHLSPFPSGKLSPYAKLAASGGKVLCLGVGPDSNTMFHCVEDVLEGEFPVQVYEDGLTHVRVVMGDGTALEVAAYIRSVRWTYCCDAVRMIPYLREVIRSASLNGVEVHLVDADGLLKRLMALARVGVHMYGTHFPASPPTSFRDLEVAG